MKIKPAGCLFCVLSLVAFSGASLDPENYIGMVYIPGSLAVIGTDDGFAHEKPRHTVKIRGFYMDKYEVTNAQYKIFLDATGHTAPFDWTAGKFQKNMGNYPVTNVSYYDAAAYAKWAGKRLPAEEEWEKAARGNKAFIYPWGNEWEDNRANVKSFLQLFDGLKAVGGCAAGKSEYGVFDLSGNAKEWTDSWFTPYPGGSTQDKEKTEQHRRYKVVRGGSYMTTKGMSQAFRRDVMEPADFSYDLGFRCIKGE
ncbi:MAG: hypothetical protein A2297_04305 [Elusimicrobia bacterium RIFOXYB2_FULL_48_7]|nr:MAG: hypothetical protein A2297_04305 [Elusimicrobia bacterium RIFOXYB2_FULL_48_7]